MIDIEAIASELGFDTEDVLMLMNMFIESCENSLQNIKDAISANDFETIKNEAHAIKGSSANLKLDDIRVLAKQIEEFAAKKDNSIDYNLILVEIYEKVAILKKVQLDYA